MAYAPQPGMGETGTVTITPGAAWDWGSNAVNRFWNYDSMFIWVKTISADVSYGYQAAEPYDYVEDIDADDVWAAQNYRMFFRAVMSIESVGDVPVSGTLNTIEIPNMSLGRSDQWLENIPAGTAVYDTEQLGSGELLMAIFYANSLADMDNLRPRIVCDGNQTLPFDAAFDVWYDLFIGENTPGITLGKWDATNQYYTIVVTLPLQFKRSLKIGFYNQDGAAVRDGEVGYVYKKIP